MFPLCLELHKKMQWKSIKFIIDGWMKTMLTWCYNISCKLITLELHSSCLCTVAIELHKLHTYIVPHTISCIHCDSCNSFNNTHDVKKCWVTMKLQVVIATQKPSYEAIWKAIICKKIKEKPLQILFSYNWFHLFLLKKHVSFYANTCSLVEINEKKSY